MASDEEDRSGRRNARRVWRVVRAALGFMIVAITLDHVFFGEEAKLSDAERAQETGALGAVYKVEHTVEHAITHTLHDIGAGIDRGLHTHVFHNDHDDESVERSHRGGGGGEGGGEGSDDAAASSSSSSYSTHEDASSAAEEEPLEPLEPVFRDVSNLKLAGEAATPTESATTEERSEEHSTTTTEDDQDENHGNDREGDLDGANHDSDHASSSSPSFPSSSSSSDATTSSQHNDPSGAPATSKWPIQLGAMNRKQAQRAVLSTLNGREMLGGRGSRETRRGKRGSRSRTVGHPLVLITLGVRFLFLRRHTRLDASLSHFTVMRCTLSVALFFYFFCLSL